jgi:Zn finger protein HypA/HybF involved in hydrogenase expression
MPPPKFGFRSDRIPDLVVFVENSTYARHNLKRRIIKQKLIPYECEDCGTGDEWNGKPISLQLEHKNGVHNDNRLENLCFLCPNCHSQSDTYAGKNKKLRRVQRLGITEYGGAGRI